MAASSPALSGTPGRMRSRKSEENAVANQPIDDQWSRGSKQDRFSGPGGLGFGGDTSGNVGGTAGGVESMVVARAASKRP